jgi:hypothetical protein
MYLETTVGLNEITNVSLEEFNINVGLFKQKDGKILLVNKNLTKSGHGEFVGYFKVAEFSNEAEFKIKIDEIFRSRLPSSLYFAIDDLKQVNLSDVNAMTILLLLSEYDYLISLPEFFNKCEFCNTETKELEPEEEIDLFAGAQALTKEEKIENAVKKFEHFKKTVLCHISLEKKLELYDEERIRGAKENAPLTITLADYAIERLSEEEKNLLALCCMINLPMKGYSRYVARYDYLSKFLSTSGELNVNIMRELGFSENCINDIFLTHKIHRDYFVLKIRRNEPLVVYVDTCDYENNCLLDIKDELMAWKQYTKLMQEQYSH